MSVHMDDLLRILAVLALIGANAFFVIGEFAVVTARRSGLLPAAEAGSRRAQAALRLMDDPVRVISTVQVGITALGIATGALSEPLVRGLLGDAIPVWLAVVIAGYWTETPFSLDRPVNDEDGRIETVSLAHDPGWEKAGAAGTLTAIHLSRHVSVVGVSAKPVARTLTPDGVAAVLHRGGPTEREGTVIDAVARTSARLCGFAR